MVDLIVKSGVKEQLDGMNVAADFHDALDDDVADLIADAARRAEATTGRRSSHRTSNDGRPF